MLDLSCYGARLNLIHSIKVNDTFWVSLPGRAPLSAKISWVNGFIAGCEFTNPLHPSTFDDIMNGSPRTKVIDRRKPKLPV